MSNVKVTVGQIKLIQDSTPGQADGVIEIPLQVSGLSNAGEAVQIESTVQGLVIGGDVLSALGFAMTEYAALKRMH